jgi:hypothetical protein
VYLWSTCTGFTFAQHINELAYGIEEAVAADGTHYFIEFACPFSLSDLTRTATRTFPPRGSNRFPNAIIACASQHNTGA